MKHSLQLLSLVATAYAQCSSYSIDGLPGAFSSVFSVDFSKVNATNNVTETLESLGFVISTDLIDTSPNSHIFEANNIAFKNDSLQLVVTAYNGTGPVLSAEFATNFTIKYLSARTVMRTSSVPGVCASTFFYESDQQEIDWEILSTTVASANDYLPAGIWATNQAVIEGQNATDSAVSLNGTDPSLDFHEYRIDWIPGETSFYIDGKFQRRFTDNLPTKDGTWTFNAWSDGDPNWTNGPPTSDSITEYKSFTMYYDYTANATGTCLAPGFNQSISDLNSTLPSK